jgi:hypothetical protein
MVSSGMLRHVALVRTEVSEEISVSFFRVTGINELGTTLAVTSNRRTLRRNTQPHGVTTQKTPFFFYLSQIRVCSSMARGCFQTECSFMARGCFQTECSFMARGCFQTLNLSKTDDVCVTNIRSGPAVSSEYTKHNTYNSTFF